VGQPPASDQPRLRGASEVSPESIAKLFMEADKVVDF
jgi:hypothetical protein